MLPLFSIESALSVVGVSGCVHESFESEQTAREKFAVALKDGRCAVLKS